MTLRIHFGIKGQDLLGTEVDAELAAFAFFPVEYNLEPSFHFLESP